MWLRTFCVLIGAVKSEGIEEADILLAPKFEQLGRQTPDPTFMKGYPNFKRLERLEVWRLEP
jgi:hypothetical protein